MKFYPVRLEIKDGEKVVFEGSAEIAPLNYDERLAMAEDSGLEFATDGTVDNKKNVFKQVKVINDLLKKRVKAVKVKHVPTGLELDSLDALKMYAECDAVINELSGRIVSGLRLGELV